MRADVWDGISQWTKDCSKLMFLQWEKDGGIGEREKVGGEESEENKKEKVLGRSCPSAHNRSTCYSLRYDPKFWKYFVLDNSARGVCLNINVSFRPKCSSQFKQDI